MTRRDYAPANYRLPDLKARVGIVTITCGGRDFENDFSIVWRRFTVRIDARDLLKSPKKVVPGVFGHNCPQDTSTMRFCTTI
jgi:hypothetical protein